MRLTYSKYERMYINNWDGPAWERSAGRLFVHFGVAYVIGEFATSILRTILSDNELMNWAFAAQGNRGGF